jgi:hypothetical protein
LDVPSRASRKFREFGPVPKSKMRSQLPTAPVKENAEMKETPVVPGVI